MLLKTQMSVGLLKYLEPPRALPENKIHHFTFELRKIIHIIEDLKKMVKVVLLNFVLSTSLTSTFPLDIWKHSHSWHRDRKFSPVPYSVPS